MKFSKIYILIFPLLFSLVLNAQGEFSIKIIVPDALKKFNVELLKSYESITNDDNLKYSIKKTNEGFIIYGNLKNKFEQVTVKIFDKPYTKDFGAALFITNSHKMKLHFKDLNEYPLMYNFPFADEQKQFNSSIALFERNLLQANRKNNFLEKNEKNKPIIDSLENEFFKNKEAIRTITKSFIRNNKSKYISLYYFYRYLLRPAKYNIDTINYYFYMLKDNVEGGLAYTKIAEKVASLNNINIGSKIYNFEFETTDNKSYEVTKSFENNEFLICFWASWCGPCIREIPFLKTIYSKYQIKGLELLSISTDEDENDWKKCLKTQNMPWLQTIVSKIKQKEEFQKHFKVGFIPQIFLVNKDGIIIYHNAQNNDDDTLSKLNKILESKYQQN